MQTDKKIAMLKEDVQEYQQEFKEAMANVNTSFEVRNFYCFLVILQKNMEQFKQLDKRIAKIGSQTATIG